MNKYEIAEYLVNLTFLLEHHEKYGAEKNKWIVKEFAAVNEEYLNMLKELHKEEDQ